MLERHTQINAGVIYGLLNIMMYLDFFALFIPIYHNSFHFNRWKQSNVKFLWLLVESVSERNGLIRNFSISKDN